MLYGNELEDRESQVLETVIPSSNRPGVHVHNTKPVFYGMCIRFSVLSMVGRRGEDLPGAITVPWI